MGHISSSRRIRNLAGLSWFSPGLTAGRKRKSSHRKGSEGQQRRGETHIFERSCTKIWSLIPSICTETMNDVMPVYGLLGNYFIPQRCWILIFSNSGSTMRASCNSNPSFILMYSHFYRDIFYGTFHRSWLINNNIFRSTLKDSTTWIHPPIKVLLFQYAPCAGSVLPIICNHTPLFFSPLP